MKKPAIILGIAVLSSGLFYLFNRTTPTSEISEVLGKEISITKGLENSISGIGEYSLDCGTTYYTAINTGGTLIPNPYIKISEGHEKQVLYVEDKTAKFFGANYFVVQDDSEYLVILRTYPVSGLTEVITLNKKNGVGFDTKTLAFGISGGPNSDTYILNCSEI